MSLQIRRGPTADRLAIIPNEGELVYDVEEKSLYVGDGTTAGGVATSPSSPANIEDLAAGLFTNGDHTNLNYVYDALNDKINSSVDLSNYIGQIQSDGFVGSVYAYDDSLMIDGILKSFNLDQTIRTDVVPNSDGVYDLGSSSNKFRDLYLSGNSLFLGDAIINSVGSAIDLPFGSTVNGVPIGEGSGIEPGGEYQINIIGNDSSVLVDHITNTISGNFVGELTGNVIGDNFSVIVDSSTNTVTGSFSGELTGNVIGADSSVIVNSSNNSIEASGGIIGELRGNVLADDFSLILDASNKSISATGGFIGDLSGNVIGNDSSIIIDAVLNTVTAPGGITGNLFGNVLADDLTAMVDTTAKTMIAEGGIIADVVGSVFSDNSTMMIDGFAGQVVGDINARLAGDLEVNFQRIVGQDVYIAPEIHTLFGSKSLNRNGAVTISRWSYDGGVYGDVAPLKISQQHNSSSVDKQIFYRARDLAGDPDAVVDGDRIGEIAFVGETLDISGISSYSAILRGRVEGTPSSSAAPGRFEFITHNGTDLQQSVQITSNGTLKVDRIQSLDGSSLTVVGDFVGSVFADDSSRVVDGATGSITAGSFVQFASLTTAERDALTPAFGMVIYNSTANRFQGYQNTGGTTPEWINLDDGTSA